MLVIDRIRQIIEKESISVSAFEKKCGLSNNSIQTALKRKANLKDITLNSILVSFPQYDPTWLLTGKGKMIQEKDKKDEESKTKTKNTGDDKLGKENAILKSKLKDLEKRLEEETAERVKENKKNKKIRGFYSIVLVLILSSGLTYQMFLRPYNNERLFNRFYESYDAKYDNSHNLLQAIMNYQQGNYEKAIEFFKLSDSLTVSEKFYMAIAYNEQGEYQKAIELLSLVKELESGYSDDADWYLGLSYLKIGETERAVNQFKKIADSNSPYKDKSIEVLNEIKIYIGNIQ